jgi:purine-cytosine permease-like protein
MRKKAFNMFFSFLYPVADFLAINFAILLSYKVYRIFDIGQYVYYQKIHIVPMSLMASFAAVIILFIFGAYKSADYADYTD